MREITSQNSFKTCHIAHVKEEKGLLTRKAPNRQGAVRKIKVPKLQKIYIEKAMEELKKEGIKQTYKNIQKKAFEIYQREKKEKSIEKYFGSIKANKNLSLSDIEKIVEDEDIMYEI